MMSLHMQLAPALFWGLAARVLFDFLFTIDQSPVVLGSWFGISLWYAFQTNSLFFPVIVAFIVRTVLDFFQHQNPLRTVISLAFAASTFILTEFFSPTSHPTSHRTLDVRPTRPRRPPTPRRHTLRTVSDITSVDSNSEMIGPRGTMNLLEREIAALRARASLADSERRRFKEERKWAKEQGNTILASQMKWEIKRYTALMKSFHREADLKVAEGIFLSSLILHRYSTSR